MKTSVIYAHFNKTLPHIIYIHREMITSRAIYINHRVWWTPWASTRYVKLRIVHAPACRERFPCHRRLVIPTCITARALSMPGSLTSGFFWSRWRGKRSWHSRRMRNPQFYVAGKRSILITLISDFKVLGLHMADFITYFNFVLVKHITNIPCKMFANNINNCFIDWCNYGISTLGTIPWCNPWRLYNITCNIIRVTTHGMIGNDISKYCPVV